MNEPKTISDFDRALIMAMCEEADKLFREFQQLQPEYEKRMATYAQNMPVQGKYDKKAAYSLKYAMPQEMYHWFRQVAPDGMQNFDQNHDFMGWLKKAYPWMRQFELADRPLEKC